ncbi:acyltransferase family protein [Virgibacillus proomii]|uniref:acyltransferase family protein n=1 Tax=Virgibacillus proomii TaxID=84407 RepID=UPI001C0F83E8|nr:acyltransferase family protein [Virgibacillus proomii]MBU5266523.1 acetyltransferase [Virgibacillus proomii]
MNDNKMFRNQMGKRYMPGLDGLRALSVLAVIAYHLNLKWAQGGFLGVGIFFVLSGYLITDQIMKEWEDSQKLHLLNFWSRRVRRLLPAMAFMLFFVALWFICVDPSRLPALKGDFISSLFYVNNWWLIYHKVSYFESFGPASPLGHLWSLSIEMQFYLIWPLVLLISLKKVPYRIKFMRWILACAALSALAMALIYVPGTDPSRVYYGTDTRAFALLVGAGLAVIWPSWKMIDKVSIRGRGILDIVGALGLFVLITMIYRTGEFDDSLYRGGFFLLSFISAVVIAVLAHPASRLGKVMGCKPLRWLGTRSYSLYIWHFPVIILSSPAVNTEGPSVLRILLQLVISFILADLSYKYVEEPFRRGKYRAKHLQRRQRTAHRRFIWPVFLMALLPVFLMISCGILSEPKSETPIIEDVQKAQEDTDKTSLKEAADNQTETVNEQTQTSRDLGTQSGEDITVIGDSVILGAAPYLEDMLPGIVIDADVSRQMRHAQEVIDELKAKGKLGDRIIIELGTNGPFNTEHLSNLLGSLSRAKQIILVNTRVPREWQDTVNENISEVAKKFSNTTVVDWYSASKGKDHYFYDDGVHLKPKGAKYYASIIVKALKE